MSKVVPGHYGVVYGKCDSSDWFDIDIELDDEAEKAYNKAKEEHIPFECFKELNAALDAAYGKVEKEEIENSICFEDEFVMECQGEHPVDPDEINDLVAARDPHAMEFFDLQDLTEDELEEWDANDLDELPLVRDFDKDFVPCSPFDNGWILRVEFVEDPTDE